MPVELATAKACFLDRTRNSLRSTDRSLAAALAAASQHNLLYAAGTDRRARSEVRAHWMRRLEHLGSSYATERSSTEYEQDVLDLRDEMTHRFSDHFRTGDHPRYPYASGFRISHAQKSLSIYLKHLWCMDLIGAPPECPVDSIVLRRAGATDTRWAWVNSIEIHRSQVATLRSKANEMGLGLAEWELGAWNT